MKRISMWSGPRNISTAMMYAFHHRGDCKVYDEPFYAHYLKETGLNHPGRDKILAHHEAEPGKVIHDLMHAEPSTDIIFMKNMPHHMIGVDLSFVSEFSNFFLIREPRAMIASYIKKIPNVTMRDLGLDLQFQLFERLLSEGLSPPVVDSSELLKNPEGMLEELCHRLGIPFIPGMSKWKAGPIDDDGIWAEHWYGNVHASKGLVPVKIGKEAVIPEHLEELAQECSGYYEELKKYEIEL